MESPAMVLTPHYPEHLKVNKRIHPPMFMQRQKIYRAPDRDPPTDLSQEEEWKYPSSVESPESTQVEEPIDTTSSQKEEDLNDEE